MCPQFVRITSTYSHSAVACRSLVRVHESIHALDPRFQASRIRIMINLIFATSRSSRRKRKEKLSLNFPAIRRDVDTFKSAGGLALDNQWRPALVCCHPSSLRQARPPLLPSQLNFIS